VSHTCIYDFIRSKSNNLSQSWWKRSINDTSWFTNYNVRFYFSCESEGDQEEYEDVKNSNEDERNLLGRLL